MAIVGYIVVDNGVIVHPLGAGLSSAAAHDVMVQNGVMGNALVFIGAVEMVSWIATAEMLQGSGREPGDFGLGLGFLKGKSGTTRLSSTLALAARLASTTTLATRLAPSRARTTRLANITSQHNSSNR
jgi:hypothetical protein